MPSKKSKHRPSPASHWKVEQNCAEAETDKLAKKLASELQPGDRVLLEGPLGVGKSTFARGLLLALGVRQPPEGSPTFALAHEYDSARSEVVHIDFYRFRSEIEIEEAGIPSYFWERNAIVIAEWVSLWPSFEQGILEDAAPTRRVWQVSLAFGATEKQRDIRISKLEKGITAA